MVTVVKHDPLWAVQFETESQRIRESLNTIIVNIHHIGSTSIPDIHAKPVIDMLLEVDDVTALDLFNESLSLLGYEAMGEYGIPGRRYFRLDDCKGVRRFQLHAFQAGIYDVIRHLAFRDYMRVHPDLAALYGSLKKQLAREHRDDMDAYIAGKDSFIKEHERKALAWRAQGIKCP